MKASDIGDVEALQLIQDAAVHSWDLLVERFPEKVVYAKFEKLDRRGFIEYGVSLRRPWLTAKGRAFLATGGASE